MDAPAELADTAGAVGELDLDSGVSPQTVRDNIGGGGQVQPGAAVQAMGCLSVAFADPATQQFVHLAEPDED